MRETNATRDARNSEPDPYRRRFTWPKWNRLVTVTDEPRLFARLPEFTGWSKARHEQTARDYAAYAQAYRETGNSLIAHGEQTYGTESSLIAGGFREDWPESLKEVIRIHAYGSTRFDDIARAHWRAAGHCKQLD